MFFVLFLYLGFFCFWLHCAACCILVPQTGIKPTHPVEEARNLNHWTTKEVPDSVYF